MAPLVKSTDGEIFEVNEEHAVKLARLVGYERVIKIGPASCAGLLGLFESLKRGYINNGETIFVNMGESANRAMDFMKEAAYTTSEVDSVDECERFNREDYKEQIWEFFNNNY